MLVDSSARVWSRTDSEQVFSKSLHQNVIKDETKVRGFGHSEQGSEQGFFLIARGQIGRGAWGGREEGGTTAAGKYDIL